MRERAEQAQERLEAAGEISTVDDRQPEGPAPSFDSLVGRMIEVRWGYWVKEPKNKSGRRREDIWCEGEVVEVADGKTTPRRRPGARRCCRGAPCGSGGRPTRSGTKRRRLSGRFSNRPTGAKSAT